MSNARALYLIAAMQVTHIVDFMLMMPLGPQLMRLFEVSPTQFSVAVSAYTFSAGISGLLVAMIADRFDRKRILLVVYAGLMVATLACALAPNFATLVLARATAGAFGGVMASVTYAIVGDLTPPSHRGRATAIVGAAFPIGATLGVPLSLWLAQAGGWHLPFFTLCACCAVLWVAAWKVLPSVSAHMNPSGESKPPLQAIWDGLREPSHHAAFALTALITFSSFSVIPFIATVLTKNNVIAESNLPIAYALGGFATFFSMQMIGRWADRYGKHRVFRYANAVSLGPILAVTHAVPLSLAFILPLWVCFMVCTSARWTPALALITGATTPQLRGSFMAINSSVMQFASALGTFTSGLILIQLPNGEIGRFNVVGYVAVLVACGAFWMVRKVRTVS